MRALWWLVLGAPAAVAQPPTADMPYSSVSAALNGLHARPEVHFAARDGWTVAQEGSDQTFWYFVPPTSPAYPSAVRQPITADERGISRRSFVLCEAAKKACDKLMAEYRQADLEWNESFAKAMRQPAAPKRP